MRTKETEPYTIYRKQGGAIAVVVMAHSLNEAREYGRCYYGSGIVERGEGVRSLSRTCEVD